MDRKYSILSNLQREISHVANEQIVLFQEFIMERFITKLGF